MFNSSPFGSFGAKPAATPSPFASATTQQSGSLFGSTQPSTGFGGFGSTATTQPQTSTFGGFGGFGSTATTQPQTSTFGGFGSTATTQPQTSTFGGFGGATSTPTTSPFGSSGGSLFGSTATTQPQTSTFGGFGAGTTSSLLSTQTQPQTSTFGGFGAGTTTSTSPFSLGGTQTQPQTSTFGGFGSTFNQAQKPLGTPTPHQNTSVDGCTLVSITGMPCYSDKSFEELRFEDITHRKDAVYKTGVAAQTTSSPFGQTTSSPFGQTTTTTSTSSSPFGTQTAGTSTSPFGQQTQPQTSTFGSGSSLFGNTQATSSPFGQQTATQPSSGLFGSTPSTTPGGLFGQSQPATSSPFGQQTTTQPSSLFGAATTTPGGLFGQSLTQQPQQNSLFGQPQQPQQSSFGTGTTTTTNTGLFGSNPTTTTSTPFGTGATTTNTGLFGSSLGSTAPTPGGLFGSSPTATSTTNTGLFGQTQPTTTNTGLFGQTQPTTTNTGLFGSSLGSTTPAPGGLFGSSPTATSTTNNGLFGSSLGSTTPAPGGLFGSSPTTNAFGTAQPATSTQSTSLFGNTGLSGQTSSLFGNTSATPTLGSTTTLGTQSSSLFGNTSATPTLNLGGLGQTNTLGGGLGQTNTLGSGLGQTAQPSTSLFGGLGQTNTLGGGLSGNTGLFGQSAATPTLNLGGQQSAASSLGSSFLGSTTLQQPTQQPQLANPLQQSQQPLQQSQTPLNNLINSSNPYYPVPSAPQFASLIKQPQPNKLISQNTSQRPLSHHGYIPRSTTKLVPRRLGPGTNEDLGFTVLPNPKGLFPIDKFVSKHSKSLNINTSNETEETLKQTSKSNYSDDTGQNNISPSSSSYYNYQPSSYQASSSSSSSIPKSTTYDSFESKYSQQQSPPPPTHQQEIERQKEMERQQKETERQKEEKNKKEFINPNAPKLSKSGYILDPSIEQLQKLSDKQLREVRYFTIKRPGYGMIVFPGEVDVYGLNLDEIVEIETREVTVYKDENNKPEIGRGLNRMAYVTLENCYPKNKAGERIKEGAPLDKYETALKNNCNANDCSFISYNRSNGEWQFQVKHFSKYSVEEVVYDDMDVDQIQKQEQLLQQQQQQQQQQQINSQPQLVQKNVSFQKPLTTKKSSRFSADIISNFDSDNESASVDEDMTVPQKKTNKASFARRVNKEESGLFETSSFVPYDRSEGIAPKIQRVSEVPNVIPKKSISFNESTLISPFSQSQRQLSLPLQHQPQQQSLQLQKSSIFKQPVLQQVPKKIEDLNMIPSTNNRNYYSKIKIDSKALDRIVPKEESIIEQLKLKSKSNTSHCTQDNSMFMRRSFRIGWAPGGKFITITKSSIKTLSVKVVPTDVQHDKKESVLNLLKEHHSNSSLVPEQSKSIGWFSLAQVQHQMESQLRLNFNTKESVYYNRIWNLILMLWGNQDNNKFNSSNYSESTIRKLNLNQWLKEVITPITRDEIDQLKKNSNSSYLDRVFSHLCAKQIKEASNISIENKDFRLATIISQVWSSNTSSKELIEKQLELYKEIGADKFINEKRIEILELVSGNVDKVYKNLDDWIRCFAINFWYKYTLGSSIEDSVNSFEESFIQRLSKFPYPPYQIKPKDQVKRNHDICFLLLKLYSAFNSNMGDSGNSFDGFRNIFYPENVGKDLLDYQLSWNLYTVLKALPQLAKQPDVSNSSIIHSSFASQLEILGMWQWSIYVLLHVPDHSNFIREEAVKDVIARNAPKIKTDDREFLMKQLHIPEIWIDEAIAWYIGYDSNADIYIQIDTLFKSFQYSKIHNIIFTTIGPKYIIEKRYRLLYDLLIKLEPHASTISTWRYGGQIFLEFININFDYKEALSKLSIANDELERGKSYFNLRIIATRINSLLNDISKLSQSSDLNNTTAAYKHSLSFMSESLINRSSLLKDLPENTTVKLNTAIGNLISTINELPLTQSYRSKNLDTLAIQIQDSLLKSIYNNKN